MKVYLSLLCVVIGILTGCASQGMKAPCDHYASFCGSKTKINHW